MHKRLTHGVGYDIRETADTVSLTIDKFIPDSDQFEVGHKEVDGTHWFTIKPGYCTVMDHAWGGGPTSEFCNGAGELDLDSVGSVKVEYQGTGVTNLYKVNSCNAYGDKRTAAANNLLTSNEFRPDASEHRTIVIFLYRHTPGVGVPKLAVCSWPTMESYFLNSSNWYHTSPEDPRIGCPPVIAVRRPYTYTTVVGASTTYNFYTVPGLGSDAFTWTEWFGLGTHIQVLAYYDKTEKRLYQVKRGHVRMDATPTTIMRDRDTATTDEDDKFLTNTGWHAYFYASPAADSVTGLKFASPPAQGASEPPF